MNPLGFLRFFRSEILYVYLGRPDKYSIEFGLHGGHIKSTESAPPENLINLRFAFRELPDGELAIAAYKPDLMKNTAASEQSKWDCFELDPSEFQDSPDPKFEEWVSVYLKGDWAKETPPLQQLIKQVEWANALSQVHAGCGIFSIRHTELVSLRFPFVNHTHAYEDAHRELYRYINDALDVECINKLGSILKRKSSNSKKGYKALKAAFPEATYLQEILGHISKYRGKSVHKVRESAVRCEAYETFVYDLERLAKSVEHLVYILEYNFYTGKEKALALASLPTYSDTPVDKPENTNLSKYLHQEISGVEVCEIKKSGEVSRDALRIRFNSGSQIAITFHADGITFISKKTPAASDMSVSFSIIDHDAIKQLKLECSEDLTKLYIHQGVIQKLVGRQLVGFRIHAVTEDSAYLPQRQLLFLDLEDGSSVVVEPTWNLGDKVEDGLVHLVGEDTMPESIHLQLGLVYIPPW